MTERSDILVSIANTIKDYRAGEIAEPTPAHVDRWISQFERDVQVPMLRELDYVFKQTYVPKLKVQNFLENVASTTSLTGNNPRDFWKAVHILNIQKDGGSQAEMLVLFGEILQKQYGLGIDACDASGGAIVYLDDAIFTGDRIINDLAGIVDNIPPRAQLDIIVIAINSYAEFWFRRDNRIQPALDQKQINVRFWRAITFENRRSWRDRSGALSPTDVLRPEEISVRSPKERASRLFSSVEGRQLLENEFLKAGTRIQGLSQYPNPMIKPLGYYKFGDGFGSLFVSYRNCPNNCPLALWWSLGDWYPLFPRKTYQR